MGSSESPTVITPFLNIGGASGAPSSYELDIATSTNIGSNLTVGGSSVVTGSLTGGALITAGDLTFNSDADHNIYGGNTTGNSLILLGNSTDIYPRLTVIGNSEIYFDIAAGQQIRAEFDGDIQLTISEDVFDYLTKLDTGTVSKLSHAELVTSTGNLVMNEIDGYTNATMGTDLGLTALKLKSIAPNGSGTSYILDGYTGASQDFYVKTGGVGYFASSLTTGGTMLSPQYNIGTSAQTITTVGGSLIFTDGITGAKTLAQLSAAAPEVWTRTGTDLAPTNAGDSVSGVSTMNIAGNFTFGSNADHIIYGGTTAGNDITIYPNTSDLKPYLQLQGGGNLILSSTSSNSIFLSSEGTTLIQAQRLTTRITGTATTGTQVDLDTDGVTSGRCMEISAKGLTSGQALRILLDSDIVTTGKGIQILSGPSSATEVFAVDEDGEFNWGGLASYGGGVTKAIATVQTSDATVTTLHSVTLDDNSGYYYEAIVTAMESDGSDRNLYHIEGLFYRDGAGAVQQGATTSITTIESEAGCACVFDVDTNDMRLRITGVAAETWNWKAVIKYNKVI